MNQLQGRLKAAIEEADLTICADTQQKLNHYLHALIKWNKHYNLTAITEPNEILTKHLLDSLVVIPHLLGERIIDVGTGPGLPGIPLALSLPEKQFVLLDTKGKKTRFLKQIIHELQLNNVEVVQSRVEHYQPPQLFDNVISRAFASVTLMLEKTKHLCHAQGVFSAMKGRYVSEETAQLSAEFYLQKIIKLNVPNLSAQRYLLIIGKS